MSQQKSSLNCFIKCKKKIIWDDIRVKCSAGPPNTSAVGNKGMSVVISSFPSYGCSPAKSKSPFVILPNDIHSLTHSLTHAHTYTHTHTHTFTRIFMHLVKGALCNFAFVTVLVMLSYILWISRWTMCSFCSNPTNSRFLRTSETHISVFI